MSDITYERTQKMKRTVLILLVLSMIAALFCGCGTGSSASRPASEPEKSQAEAPTAAPDASQPEDNGDEASYFPLAEPESLGIFISFIPPVVGEIGDDPMTYTVWRELAERLNVDLEFTVTTHDVFRDKTAILVASNEYPDIMMNLLEQHYNYSGDQAIEDGVAMDLTELVEEYMPNYKSHLYSNPDYVRDASTDAGKIAAIFCLWNKEVGAEYGPVIRQDWLDRVDMEAPVTYDDYYNVLTAFKTEIGASAPIWFCKEGGVGCNYLASGYGTTNCASTMSYTVYYKVVDGKVVFCPTTGEFRDYLTTMHKWYSEGLIYQNYYDADNDRSNISDDLISTESTGIWYIYNEYFNNHFNTISEDPNFKIVAIQDAVKSAAEGGHLTSKVNVVSTNHACITTNCENPELAARFIDYLYSEDGMLLMNYGVEGEGFNYVDGKPVLSDLVIHNPDGLSVTAALTKYAQQQGLMLCDVDRFSAIYSQEDLAPWNVTDNDWAYPQWASTTDEEAAQIGKVMTDVLTYINENLNKFIIGERSLDEFDAYVERLEAMNVADVTAIYQTVYERYKAR